MVYKLPNSLLKHIFFPNFSPARYPFCPELFHAKNIVKYSLRTLLIFLQISHIILICGLTALFLGFFLLFQVLLFPREVQSVYLYI